eukprot:TRINITY_DN16475_c0_g1_i1.p1 TRINITY_DN16475_c0_g1~~TRINITY_DN16475_c0_g1_i1.p1  ORF type:complete len:444 (+),score=65.14 TRINITY_DN16475_c0_g1_i1:58-1332(+)
MASKPAAATSSTTAAAVNLAKNLVGASIFSLPAGLLRGSVVYGLGSLFLVGASCAGTFVLIAFLCRNLNATSYRDAWCAAFGKKSGDIVDVSIFLNGLFACVSYVILIADFMSKAVEGLLGWQGASRTMIIALVTGTCLLPLSLFRDLSPLKYTSMLGLLIIGFVIAYVVSDFFGNIAEARPVLEEHSCHLGMGVFSMVALSTGAFKAHYNAPRFFKELGGDLHAHSTAVAAAYGGAFLIYACFAVAGFGLFGEDVMGNVLRNYPATSTAVLLVQCGMAFAIIFTYPLVFSSARESLIGMSPSLRIWGRFAERGPPSPQQNKAHLLITSVMVALISVVACGVDDVSLVTGILGATIGSSLCWIFPGLMYLKTHKSPVANKSLHQPLTGGPALVGTPLLRGLCMLCVVTGFASATLGVAVCAGVL